MAARREPLLPFGHVKEVAPRVPREKVASADGVRDHFREQLHAPAAQESACPGDVARLDARREDPQVADLGAPLGQARGAAGVLPDLEARAALQVGCQDGPARLHGLPRVAGHEGRVARVVEQGNVGAEAPAIPAKRLVEVGHPDADLLDPADEVAVAHQRLRGTARVLPVVMPPSTSSTCPWT